MSFGARCDLQPTNGLKLTGKEYRKTPRKRKMKKRIMKSMMIHLNRLHTMYLRVLYGEENHRKDVSGRLLGGRRGARMRKGRVGFFVCVLNVSTH